MLSKNISDFNNIQLNLLKTAGLDKNIILAILLQSQLIIGSFIVFLGQRNVHDKQYCSISSSLVYTKIYFCFK